MRERMREMRQLTQHSMNVLHLYCRMRELGVSKDMAAGLCRWVERFSLVYKLMYI